MLRLLSSSCSRCGASVAEVWLCPGCGEQARGGRVSLGRAAAAPPWILVHRGPAGEVARALEGAPSPPGAAPGRVGAALALLRRLAPSGAVSLVVDLRPAEVAGHPVRRTRVGPRQEWLVEQPWLALAAQGVEASAVRIERRVRERSFARGGVREAAAGCGLDEVRARTPAGGLRLVLRSPERLGALGLPAPSPEVPWPRAPLRPTAPGGVAAPGSLLPGLAATLALVAAASLVSLGARALGGGAAAQRAARTGAVAPAGAARRSALVEAAALPASERLRLLRWTLEGDPDPAVRDLALELLAEQGPRGLAAVAWVHRRGPGEVSRLQARRLLIQRAPGLAVEAALDGLAAGGASPQLRLGWVLTLAEAGAPGDERVVAALREGLADAAPRVRGQAALALVARRPSALRLAAAEALGRAVRDAAAGVAEADRGLLALGRAVARLEGGAGLIRQAAAAGGLPVGLARRLARVVDRP